MSANSGASTQNGSTPSSASAATDTAQGGSSNETNEALTNQKDPLSNPVLQPISVDVPPLSLPPITFTVGSEEAQGMWGEAKSMLAAQGVSNPTDAQIEDMDKQLLSANPGVTTLQVGQQLNFPDGSTSSQGIETYNGMDQSYEAQITSNEMAARAQLAQSAIVTQEQQAGLDAFNAQVDSSVNAIWSAPPPSTVGSGAQQSPDMVMQSIGYMAWAPMTPAQANGVAKADEALLPVALTALVPGLQEFIPAELSTGASLAIVGGKTAVGFGLGYYGARETGTVSTTGQLAAGATGALALNIGGPTVGFLTDQVPGLGTFASTTLVSGVSGSATELAAQTGDHFLNNVPMSWTKVGYVGLTTAFASATMGESALATGADYAELGPTGTAITEGVGATTTELGSFVADKIWEGAVGETPSTLQPVSANNPFGLPGLTPQDWQSNSTLWNINPK